MNKVDSKQTPLFVIHPIEGTVAMLESVMSQVNTTVYGLQYSTASPSSSIQDLATYYLQKIREISPSGPYRLAGYSFGACIALEIALQLEWAAVSAGDSSTTSSKSQPLVELVLLDGSHSYVAANIGRYKEKMDLTDTARMETEGLCAFITHFALRLTNAKSSQFDMQKLAADLLKCPDFDSRVNTAINMLSTAWMMASSDAEDLKIAALAFFNRLVMADSYKPSSKLNRSNVMLVRASQTTKEAEQLGSDYGLHEVSVKPVTVHVVSGTHESFITGLSGTKVANLINSQLNK
jgi:fatty acid synthase